MVKIRNVKAHITDAMVEEEQYTTEEKDGTRGGDEAANVGATRLVETCSKLEVIGERDFKARCHEYLAKVEQQIADIRNCLKAGLSDDNDAKASGSTTVKSIDRQTARNDR